MHEAIMLNYIMVLWWTYEEGGGERGRKEWMDG